MVAAMPVYRRICEFSLLFHFIVLCGIYSNVTFSYSFLREAERSGSLVRTSSLLTSFKTVEPGNTFRENIAFTGHTILGLTVVVLVTWLYILLTYAGDIHPNPGPLSTTSSNSDSTSTSNMSSSILDSLNLNHHLSFVHYNVQSILTKLEILNTELLDFDILAFSETWLSSAVKDEDLLLQLFNSPERKDRVGDRYGGVIVYIKEGIHYKRRKDLEVRGVECIWVEIINKHKHILFGLFYRPPNTDSILYSNIEDSLHLAVDTGISDIIVTGDFNFNLFNHQLSKKIESFCNQFAFHQCINQATHFTQTSSSLLDIVLITNKHNLVISGVGDPFLNQDLRYHCPVFGILKFSKPKITSYTRHIWTYNQGNYNLLREKAANTDWNSLQDNNINIHAENITNYILTIAKECIPNKTIRVRPSEPPWITSNIKQNIRRRKRAYKKAKRTNSIIHWNKFRKQRNKVTSLIHKAKQSYFDSLSSKLKSNTLSPKDWWKTLKRFISPNTSSTIPPLETNRCIYTDEQEKANALNNYFTSQTYLNDHNAVLPDLTPTTTYSTLDHIILTPLEVESILKNLVIGKASGPNGLSNRILKELSREISNPLCTLFNESLDKSQVPNSYKVANVSSIYKKDDPSLASNYRPISLLNSEDKVFERLIFKHLYNHLKDNNLLTPLQSGFIPGDSTVNQLAFLYNTFCKALDSGKEVRVVFLDISKAFDRVWHAGLIHKLKAAGVSGKMLLWFQNYLSDRKQRVILPGAVSDWTDIKAGVPQGSILGPLLFLLYINDIVNDINSSIRLFADDTSLFIIVDNPVTSAEQLNFDLRKVLLWADTWLVSFNVTKTEALLISRKINRPIHPPIYMNNQQITEINSHKHLGIYFSNDCSWHDHINYTVEKAWGRINVMRKLKFKLDRKALETIFIAFIRPLLEYGDIIWDNCTQYEKQELEKVQIEAARIATGTTKLVSLNSLYTEIGWQTLQQRRTNHKLTLFYKMKNNLSPTYLSSLVPQSVNSISRYNLRNADDLQSIASRTNLYYMSFLPSVVRDWNNLPEQAKQLDSVNSFKSYLNRDRASTPKYYYVGSRKSQILHTRLRTNCSCLNHDLFLKNIVDSPLCRCGNIETTYHFFFSCPYYVQQRLELSTAIGQHRPLTLNLLLFGDPSLSQDINALIFNKVQTYILDTRRFS